MKYHPDKEELASFRELINDNMPLEQKTKMNIIELEGNNIMNILARSVLEMYRFDPNPDDTSRDNLMRQSIDLISKFPTIIAYAFNMLRHATFGRSLHIRHPQENLSIAENFLVCQVTCEFLQQHSSRIGNGIYGMPDAIYQSGLIINLLIQHTGKVSIDFVYIGPVLNIFL